MESAPKTVTTKPRSTRPPGRPIATHLFGYVLENAFLFKYAKEHQCEVYRSDGSVDRDTLEAAVWNMQKSGAMFARLALVQDRSQPGGIVFCLYIANNLRPENATEERTRRLKAAVGVDEDPQWIPIRQRP
ncbi:hypothetical protein BV22DRAFT_1132819 [Leucogyrophana mollusca]|uniref:Uncharacterized protein n=1 Tax=Leucogyrophana mollusca TaxID=85980 RepID=A0ACB8B4W8_9AGAM|nr:hypothetical protein BV22DRAFT_1132819 [Leucogyrophana mollusca]